MRNTVLYRWGVVVAIGMGVLSLFLQALWQRELSVLVGNTLYGVTLVLAGWMAGYGSGSFLFLWVESRVKRRLALLFWTQIVVCGLALLLVPAFSAMRVWPKPWVYVGAFVSVFVPSLSWGMGLPVLGSVFGTEGLSRFYGWNTLASAVAVLVMDFVLLPFLGARASLLVALVLGVVVFGGGLVFVWRHEKGETTGRQWRFSYRGGGLSLVLFGLSGFTSLGYQLIYNRQLLYFTGNTIFCYAVITAVFIGGLALGSLLYARWRLRWLSSLWLWMGILEGVVALWHALFPSLSVGVNALLVPLKTGGIGFSFVVRFLAASLLIGVPVVAFGMLYPLFLDVFHGENGGDDGADTALAAGVNTLGSVVGVFVVAFVLVGRLGISQTLRLLAWLSGLLASLAFVKSRDARVGWWLAGVGVGLMVLPVQDQIGRMAAQEFRGSEILYYKEGAHGTVSVTRHPEGILHLKINGVGEVPTDYHSLRVFRLMGVLPFVAHPQASRVLVVALGGGITFGTVMEVPGVQATNVEICEDVLEAAEWFSPYNHDVVKRFRDRMVIEDGVTYMLRSRENYDVILADATHPASGDSWVLYTRDFYQMAKARLTSGGVMAQWVPIHNLSSYDLQVIVRTFASVYPFAELFFCNEYLVMVGSERAITLSDEGWKRILSNPILARDLAMVHLGPAEVADMIVWQSGGSVLWDGDVRLSTLDYSPLQFSEWRSRKRDTRVENIALLLQRGVFGEKTRRILEFHQALFEKEYIRALTVAYSWPARLQDEAWAFQKTRVENWLLLSLRSPEGMQRVVDQASPETMGILERLEVRDPLHVGVARALVLAARGKYHEAYTILQGLTNLTQERWLGELREQIERELR